jgi:hemolysin III
MEGYPCRTSKLAVTVGIVSGESAERIKEQTAELLKDAAREIKPRLRGWLHLGTFPVSVAAGVVLVWLSPTPTTRIATAVFAGSASLLFGSSALFHRGQPWSPRWHGILRRLDHSTIFFLIAGTYTPFAMMLLDSDRARALLLLVWGGALAGIAFRVCWIGAPRWLYLPVYIGLGWAAVFWIPDFAAAGGPAVLALIILGGLLYSVGGVVYGLRKPDPLPQWFGFHEVFHSLTIAAFAVHYIGVSMVVYSAR